MVATAGEFVGELAKNNRVIVIEGLAVVVHGFNRPTMDADIWLDPLDSSRAWVEVILLTCAKFTGLTLHTLPGWREVSGDELRIAAEEVGLLRVTGLDCPLDIFRTPNEFTPEAFDEVHARSAPNRDGTRLPDPLDLIITKLDTGREKDLMDTRFLESVVRKRYLVVMPTASLEEVKQLFARFLDWEVCAGALESPDSSVREFAKECLRDLAGDGDPFARALLEQQRIPYLQTGLDDNVE